MSRALLRLSLLVAAVAPTALAAAIVTHSSSANNGITVPPGATRSNEDGVEVQHLVPTAGRNARIEPRWCPVSPEGVVGDVPTRVTVPDAVKAKITGLDPTDTVTGQKCNNLEVTGSGGTVALGKGSRAEVTNTAAAGGDSIKVQVPDGKTVLVAPGTSQVVTTPN